jgi:uncharacterized membrane protein
MTRIFCTLIFFLITHTGCNSSRQAGSGQEKVLPAPVLSESLQQKQLDGVDLFGRGNIPASWTLEMDFGNLIRFKSLDGTQVNSTAVQPVAVPNENATRFTSRASNGDMVVLLYEASCTDAISAERYNKKITVTVNGKTYSGCGQYLFDAALSGKWILQTRNNVTLQAADFAKGLPMMNLNLQASKLTGHDGCNTMTGAFEVLGNKIKFKPIAVTKMTCPSNKNDKELSALLSGQTVDYYFKDGLLYFYLPDDSLIVFTKG